MVKEKYSKFSKSPVAIVFRPEKPEAKKAANDLLQWLTLRDIICYTHPKQKLASPAMALDKQGLKVIQLVVVLGGDGTYLEAVRMLKGQQVPILGVNLGSLGFLTETPYAKLFPTLERALSGELERRPRNLLDVSVVKDEKLKQLPNALNDIVIERGGTTQLIHIDIFSEGHLVSHVKADGLVISTPTGSTAYNLAAGGPILHPEVQATVVTPICPHSLTSRPMIFPINQTLSFKIKNIPHKAKILIDGQPREEITALHEIIIRKSSSIHYVLRKKSHNYFDLLRKKLKFGERD